MIILEIVAWQVLVKTELQFGTWRAAMKALIMRNGKMENFALGK